LVQPVKEPGIKATRASKREGFQKEKGSRKRRKLPKLPKRAGGLAANAFG